MSNNPQLQQAQAYLDQLMEDYFSINADGGSPDDRYRLLLSVANRFDIDETDLNN